MKAITHQKGLFYTAPWKNSKVEVTGIFTSENPDRPLVYCTHSCDALKVIAELNREARSHEPKPS